MTEDQHKLLTEIGALGDQMDADLREGYGLKYIPAGMMNYDHDQIERFLALGNDGQRDFIRALADGSPELDFYLDLCTSQAMYNPVHPDDARNGSHTEAKLARHPERYNLTTAALKILDEVPPAPTADWDKINN